MTEVREIEMMMQNMPIMDSRGLENMNQTLKGFALSLIPSDEYIGVVTRLSEKVLKALKAKSKAPIDRVIYAGSLGKSTEILAPDVDLVVLLSGELPPYEDVLNDWEEILRLDESLKVDPGSIRQTGISLQFKFLEEGIEVDLLPGTNFVEGRNPGGKRGAEVQSEGALENVNARNFRAYSASLSESQIRFMKDQSAFAHQVVRLAKFWFKSLYLGPKQIYGLKCMLELIAVSAAIKEDQRDGKSLLRTFAKFLDDVGNIKDLRLGFAKGESSGKWELADWLRKPRILEPSNPYNDLSKNFKNRDKEAKNLMDFAKNSRDRLRKAIDINLVGPDAVFTIFRPQPTALIPNVFAGLPRPEILSDTDPAFRKYNPNKTENNDGVMKKPGMREALKAIQIFLCTAASVAPAALLANNQPVTIDGVRTFLEKMMSEDIHGTEYKEWIPSANKHEDYDVTFTVPIFAKPELGALKTSFRF